MATSRRLDASRGNLGAIGAGAAAGRQPEQERREREQLEEAKRRRQVQEETRDAIQDLSVGDRLKVVSF